MEIKEAEETKQPESADTFQFDFVSEGLKDVKDLKGPLEQWGVFDNLHVSYFRFNQKYDETRVDNFIKDFFGSPFVRKIISRDISFTKPGVDKVKYKRLRCTHTNLDMFNKFEANNIVASDNGYIRKRMDEIIEGITVSDLVREVLIMEESEHWEIFSAEERNELLFKLFSLLALGGSLCQYEDVIAPYLEKTKLLYKSIVSARKDPVSQQVYVESFAYEITGIDDNQLFPKESPQNRCYLVVNPSIRQLVMVYHKWTAYW